MTARPTPDWVWGITDVRTMAYEYLTQPERDLLFAVTALVRARHGHIRDDPKGAALFLIREALAALDTRAVAAAPTPEYGVRYRWPGERDATIEMFPEPWMAEEELERLADNGVVDVELVTRVVQPWEISRTGLPAMIRTLADARLGEEITDDNKIRERLTRWLPDRDPDEIWQAWQDLLHDIGELRKAEDGDVDWAMTDPELRDELVLVQHLEGLVENAVRKVIGAAAEQDGRTS